MNSKYKKCLLLILDDILLIQKSMVNHIGMNINSGHYTATVRKDSTSDDWIHYDDDKITKSTDFESPNGYILFYTAE